MIFLKGFIYLILERGEGRREGNERGKQQCVVASHMSPTGDLARNPDMCPDWEFNQRPFGSQAGTQSTEPHQPGEICLLIFTIYSEHSEQLSTHLDIFSATSFLRMALNMILGCNCILCRLALELPYRSQILFSVGFYFLTFMASSSFHWLAMVQ